MNDAQLQRLSAKNEVRVNDLGKAKRVPPFFYDSLRHAFGYYFNTFITNNTSYEFYAQGLHDRNVLVFSNQVLDADNTVLTIISFQRFFELFIKDLLKRVDRQLVYEPEKKIKVAQAILEIKNGSYKVKKDNNKPLSIPFRVSLDRLYYLFDDLSKQTLPVSDKLLRKFKRVIKNYGFLNSTDHKSILYYLNWYRNRILHNGSKLPTLWLLDYIITQRLFPIISEIILVEAGKLGDSMFYLKTITGIDILDEFLKIKFEFTHLKTKRNQEKTYHDLLKIGHLKEMGRGNMNMNLFLRHNRAPYEYNYKNPLERGCRFALAEKEDYPDFKGIKNCPCCGNNSLVVYRQTISDLFSAGNIDIDWAKCYTCEYQIRYNIGDPFLFNLSKEKIFN